MSNSGDYCPIIDPHISSREAVLNGCTYHYLLGQPKTAHKATVFLLHGWPDLSYGWRYQIRPLVDMGLRVVVPDMMGYGGTDAPEPLSFYTYKRAADDINELACQLDAPKIIIGGHDWGGAVVHRVALHHPTLVSHIFSICTPYFPPSKEYTELDELVRTALPNFGYQLQLRGPEVERKVVGHEMLKKLLHATYGARSTNGKHVFTVERGFDFSLFDSLEPSPLLLEKVVDFYAEQFARNGMRGPQNWYRTRHLNFLDERSIEDPVLRIPVLFVAAKRDIALKPEMSAGMEKLCTHLTRREVNASHWALWEAPGEVNRIIGDWLQGVVFGGKSVL